LLSIVVVLAPSAAPAGELPVSTAVDAQADRKIVGPVAGAAMLLLPFLAGSMLFAQDDKLASQHLGVDFMALGFAAGPWVAHASVGRPRRTLAFGLAALTLSAAAVTFMELREPFGPASRNEDRVVFGILFTSALVTAAAGIIDGFLLAGSADTGS
jgi:hypothetical protein